MTAAVDQHTHTAANSPAADPGNIGVPVCYSVAEPNRLGLARVPGGADIDVLDPVVRGSPAPAPMAVLLTPVVLLPRAFQPSAVLFVAVLCESAS